MYCHIAKINAYAPAECSCMDVEACKCWDCVLKHVKHWAADYQAALRRVRLGMMKLQPMLKAQTADVSRM
jgi:hypothetical protein